MESSIRRCRLPCVYERFHPHLKVWSTLIEPIFETRFFLADYDEKVIVAILCVVSLGHRGEENYGENLVTFKL